MSTSYDDTLRSKYRPDARAGSVLTVSTGSLGARRGKIRLFSRLPCINAIQSNKAQLPDGKLQACFQRGRSMIGGVSREDG